MSTILLLLGGIVIALGVIFSYVVGIRALQESRRSPNYISRQQNTVRAQRAFSILGFFAVVGISLIALTQVKRFNLPSLPFLSTRTPFATLEFTQTPAPANSPDNFPTSFILTTTPAISATPSPTPPPSVPLAVEALFEGDITPQPDVLINDLKFSTRIENGLPAVISTNFSNPIRRMYVFFTYDKLDQGMQWTALWYHDGTLQHYETKPWDDKSKGFGQTVWVQPTDKWLPGFYELQIFVGSEWKSSGTFTLTGDPPTSTPTASSTPTITPSKTQTSTPAPSSTAMKTALPASRTTSTASNTPSRTPTATASATPSYTPTATATVTVTASRTPTFTPTITPSFSAKVTPSPTSTATRTPSKTPTITPSHIPTFTASVSTTITSSVTPTSSYTHQDQL